MINIDGRYVNPQFIVSAEIDNRHYMNGSETYLKVVLSDGSSFTAKHGFGFNAYAALEEIKGAMKS